MKAAVAANGRLRAVLGLGALAALSACRVEPVQSTGEPIELGARDLGTSMVFTGEAVRSTRDEAVELAAARARAAAREWIEVRVRSRVRHELHASRAGDSVKDEEVFESEVESIAEGVIQGSLLRRTHVEPDPSGRILARVEVGVPKPGSPVLLARALADRLDRGKVTRIAVYELCYPFHDELVRSSYGAELARRVGGAIANNGFSVVELTADDKVSGTTLEAALQRHQVDAVLDGTYVLADDLVTADVHVRVSRPAGEILATATTRLPVSEWGRRLMRRSGRGLDVADNLAELGSLKEVSELFHVEATDPLSRVEVSTSKPEYSIGDEIRISVESTRPGYLVLLCVDTEGGVALLSPSEHLERDRIEAGEIVSLPPGLSPGGGWRILAKPPAGIDRLKAFVSSRPLREGWQTARQGRLLEILRESLDGVRFGEGRCEVRVR